MIMKEDKIMIDSNIKKSIDNFIIQKTNIFEDDKEFIKYYDLFKERFGRNPYIAEPNGTREQTIKAIKICLEKNEDILEQLLYPNQDKFIY